MPCKVPYQPSALLQILPKPKTMASKTTEHKRETKTAKYWQTIETATEILPIVETVCPE